MHDLRYALRALRRNAGLTAVIVASLAIGIGANTAIFSVVNAVLLKPLPYPDPERLVVLWLRSPGSNIPQDWPSPGQYLDLRRENRSLDEMSISRGRVGALLGAGAAQRVEALATSSSLFTLLGARPLHGRLLRADEDTPGQPPVVVLSYAFWQRAFGGDPNIVGTAVTLSGLGQGTGDARNQFEVAGVLGPDFLLDAEIMPTIANIRQMDVFLPLPLGADAMKRRDDETFNVMARVRPGVTMTQAKSDVAAIASRIREKDNRDPTFTIDVVPLVESVVGDVRLAILVVFGSVTLVLLIACANVANLLLTYATGRQKEMAVRTALGASARRLVGQLMTESLLLGLLGGLAGLALARLALQVVRSVNPGNIPRLEAITLDSTVLVFTFGVSIVAGVLVGLLPALRAWRVDLNSSLKAGGRNAQGDGGFGSARPRVRGLLVVAEVAISVVLLVGAGLLVRSFVRLQAVSPGFQPDGVISLRVGASARQLPNRDAANAHHGPIAEALAAVPGVIAYGAASPLPLTPSVAWGPINVEGWTPPPGQELHADHRAVTPDYFRAMEIPLVQGRVFTNADMPASAEQVVIIDETFARRFWPSGDAIGKHLWFDPARKMRIVGVVGTVKQDGLDVDGRIVYYRPTLWAGYHVARTAGDPAAVGRAMVRKIHEMDPTITAVDIQTMTSRISSSLARQRFSTLMLGAFALLALILAMVGVYGVMSHLVAQGAHDIGVRMALGAERSRILVMVLKQGVLLSVAGSVLGVAGAIALTRVMASLLFGVSPTDLVTFTAVPLILIGTATIASYIPALRATRLDPVIALRNE